MIILGLGTTRTNNKNTVASYFDLHYFPMNENVANIPQHKNSVYSL